MTALTTRESVAEETRFAGLLPRRMTRYRPPRWWQEVALTLLGYWLYGLVRNAVPEQATLAERHGRAIQHLTEWLHLNFELSVNIWVAAHDAVAQVMDYYYATLHFIVTIAVLVWLFVARKRIYRGARTALYATTIIALVGFYTFPLAPPRLLPQYGYIDTLVKFHTWGSLADPKLAERSNQFAAMPSLHIAWALWCGITIFVVSRVTWLRILGLLYPLGTLMVIVGTANHFVLDAVGGAAVLAIGYGIQWLLSGHGAYVDAPDPVDSAS